MGTEAVWVPYAIAALGAGASTAATVHAQHKQEEEANAQNRTQQREQHRADARINDELGKLGESNADDERKASLDGFIQQLRANRGQAGGTAGGPGGKRFKEDSATAGAAIKNYGTGRADVMSRIAAPGLQRQGEQISAGRMQSDVQGVARDADAQRFLSALRMARIHANPYVMGAGQALMAGGLGAASAGGGGLDPIGNGGFTSGQVADAAKTIPKFSPFG